MKEVLNPPLCRQAVIVPTHGIKDVDAPHALVARDQVRMGVGKDVTDVQGTGHGGRWRVDDKRVGARPGRVVVVDAELLPHGFEARFGRFAVEVFGQGGRVNGCRSRKGRGQSHDESSGWCPDSQPRRRNTARTQLSGLFPPSVPHPGISAAPVSPHLAPSAGQAAACAQP